GTSILRITRYRLQNACGRNLYYTRRADARPGPNRRCGSDGRSRRFASPSVWSVPESAPSSPMSHVTLDPSSAAGGSDADRVTAYPWLVVIIASCGWLFDCMDQRLFVLARESAVTELLGPAAAAAEIKTYSGYATTAMILGWATGGIFFGMMSDRWGRVKT